MEQYPSPVGPMDPIVGEPAFSTTIEAEEDTPQEQPPNAPTNLAPEQLLSAPPVADGESTVDNLTPQAERMDRLLDEQEAAATREQTADDGSKSEPSVGMSKKASFAPSTAEYVVQHDEKKEFVSAPAGVVNRMNQIGRAMKLQRAEESEIKPFVPKYVQRENGKSAQDTQLPTRWKKTAHGDWRPKAEVTRPLVDGPRLALDGGSMIIDPGKQAEKKRKGLQRTKNGEKRKLPTPAELAAMRRQNTPTSGGVQQVWDSGEVQMGPFRKLNVFEPLERTKMRIENNENPRAPTYIMSNTLVGGRATTPSPKSPRSSDRLNRPISREGIRPPSSLTASRSHLATPAMELTGPIFARAGTPMSTYFSSSLGSGTLPSVLSPTRAVSPPMKFSLPETASLKATEPPAVMMKSTLPPRFKACNCTHGCTRCQEVQTDIDRFEAVKKAREDELLEAQLKLEQEEAEENERSRRSSSVGGGLQARLNAVKAVDKMKLKVQKTKHRHKIFTADDSGPTIAQLYHGMSHRDREDLYISVVGGLSFDLNREKFDYLIQRVLAPRIHCMVSEEHVHSMFNIFDINQGGTISYFEYLSALCHALISPEQTAFLQKLFELLHELPYDDGSYAPGAQSPSPNRRGTVVGAMKRSKSRAGPSDPASSPSRVNMQRPRLNSTTSVTSRTSATSNDVSMKSSAPGGMPPSPSGSDAKKKRVTLLERKHFEQDRLRRCIFSLQNHSMMFPHPQEDALASALSICFEDLQASDRVSFEKYLMFIFCDDDAMDSLCALIAPQAVELPNGDIVGGPQPDQAIAAH